MIRKPDRPIAAGSPVFVRDRNGKPVGTGYYNPRTDLALRMLGRGASIKDPEAYLLELLDDACTLREERLNLPAVTNGYRLVHAEGDGFPGLILDRLGDTIVAQVFSLCMMKSIESIGEHLLRRYPKSRLALTVDADAASKEGIDKLPPARPHPTRVTEHGIHYTVYPGTGHKTGFFADQRESRRRVGELARGRHVLDLFCNSGGFAMNAAVGEAKSVAAMDLDEETVAHARANAESNRLKIDFRHGDAFDALRDLRPGAFDLIVLDPPKWVRGKAELESGLARYRDINRLGFEKLSRGGILVTNSCSGAVTPGRFHAMLAEAAAKAGKDARILHAGGAGPDHPVALECPETRYLETVILEVR